MSLYAKARATSRAPQWWFNKIPPLLAVGYALTIARGGGRDAIGTLLLSVLTLCFGAVFANVVNDSSDVAEDARRGKGNAMSRLALSHRLVIGAVFFAATGLTSLVAGADIAAILLLGGLGFVALLYSVRPVRLKERGLVGALADTVIVHTGPVAWISLMLHRHGETSVASTVVIASSIAWATGLGLRGIIGHQMSVRETAPGLTTFGSTVPMPLLRMVVLRVAFPLEWIGVGTFTIALLPSTPVLIPVSLLILAGEWLKFRARWEVPDLDSVGRAETGYFPLAAKDVYEVWLPLALVVQLALMDPLLAGLAAGHALVFLPGIRTAIRECLDLPAQVRNRRLR